jgi:hypothetical protein
MLSDRQAGPIHPLIYPHPITGKKVNFWMKDLFVML